MTCSTEWWRLPSSRDRRKGLVVVVTGTPGTGKSTFARALDRRAGNASLIEINNVAKELGLYTGNTWHGSKEVRIRQLAAAVRRRIGAAKGLTIVVGHLAPDLGIKCDVAVVTRLGLRKLAERLSARKYHADKIRENLISEALDYCGTAMEGLARETYEVEKPGEMAAVQRYIAARAAGRYASAPKARRYSKEKELVSMVKGGNRYGL